MWSAAVSAFLPSISGELNANEKVLEDVKKEKEKLQEELDKLKIELDDLKTATAISEATKQEEVENMRRKCQEEIASLQHIMKGERQGSWKSFFFNSDIGLWEI